MINCKKWLRREWGEEERTGNEAVHRDPLRYNYANMIVSNIIMALFPPLKCGNFALFSLPALKQMM
jgi:hypothetical protein